MLQSCICEPEINGAKKEPGGIERWPFAFWGVVLSSGYLFVFLLFHGVENWPLDC